MPRQKVVCDATFEDEAVCVTCRLCQLQGRGPDLVTAMVDLRERCPNSGGNWYVAAGEHLLDVDEVMEGDPS